VISFATVFAALLRADRLRTAVAIVTASTLLDMYLAQLAAEKRRVAGVRN
jgi:hypothetical protein